jgi:nitrite reductase (NADH) small subunit
MWVEAGPLAELQRARKLVVDTGGAQVLVLWHEGEAYAFDNVCIHRERELSKGVVLNGRLVCPGHQWAFELGSGWCRERERCQPVHEVRIDDDGVVWVTSTAKEPEEAQWRPTST